MLNRTHPKCIFRKIIFRPLNYAAPQIFTRPRESPSLFGAPSTGDGTPLQLFLKGVKNWHKMQKISAYNLGVRGVAPRNFGI